MALPTTLPNYVKFLRGTPTAYSNLKASGGLSDDTLYFISEKQVEGEAAVTSGKLYLGSKLISGSGEGGGVSNLSELHDVLLGTLANNQVLVYQGGKWKNISIETLIQQFVNISFASAVFEVDSSGDTTLKGFESAAIGTIPQKSANGITWVEVPTTDLSQINQQISNLQSTVGAMYTNEQIDSKLASVNRIERTIVDSVEDIPLTEEDAVHKVYMVPNGNSEGNKYDEYMVIDGVLEPIGSSTADLTNYITNDQLTATLVNYLTADAVDDFVSLIKYNAEVGDLTQLIAETENSTLVDQVNFLTDHLTWHEITE